MDTKEIAKQIRQDLKTFKGFKFSVRMESYSGGSSIDVDIMESPIRMIRNMSEISEDNSPCMTGRYSMKDIEKMQGEKYHQLNNIELGKNHDYDKRQWNNGVFLTEAGHNQLQKIVGIVRKYHRDNSDISIDYFECNFYFSLNLGKCDVAFKDGV